MLQTCHFQLDEFIDLPASAPRSSAFRLSVNEQDRLALNRSFHDHLGNVSDFRLRISPDGYTLLLDTVGPFNLSLTKKGVRTCHELGDILRQQPISFPAVIRAEWYEPWNCWMCQYEGLQKPPAKLKSSQTPGRRRKGG